MPDNDGSQSVEQHPEEKNPDVQLVNPPPSPNDATPAVAGTVPTKPEKTEIQQLEDRMGNAEKWMVWLTAAIAFFGLCTVIVGALQWSAIKGQLDEMKSGGIDTHALAVAAKTQAEKMTDMSNAADKIRQAAEGMVDQERRIADNAKKSIEASNRQSKAALDATIAQNRLDQRAWIGIQGDQVIQFESGKPPKIQILFFNSGKTPATKTHESSGYLLSPNPISGPPPEIIKELNEELPMNPRQSIPPQGRYFDTLGDIPPSGALGQTLMEKHHFGLANIMANYDRILRGAVIFYVFGEIQYLDGSGRSHTTEYCMFLSNPEKKELQFCEGFNDLT